MATMKTAAATVAATGSAIDEPEHDCGLDGASAGLGAWLNACLGVPEPFAQSSASAGRSEPRQCWVPLVQELELDSQDTAQTPLMWSMWALTVKSGQLRM